MPKTDEERLVGFTVLVSVEFKEWLDAAAAENYRGTSQEVRMILEQERERRYALDNNEA